MIPIHTDTTNVTFKATGLEDLPATLCVVRERNPETGEIEELRHIETCWCLTPEEIEEVKRTGRVYVGMLIPALPAMCVTTSSTVRPSPEGQNDGRQK